MDSSNELFKKVIENLIECPVCRCKGLTINGEHFVRCKSCGPFSSLSIDTNTLNVVGFELQEPKLNEMPRIQEGDIVRIDSIHSAKPNCYEVARTEFGGVVSQPAGFHHRYNEIIAIYRFDGTDFKCIWERADYKEYKAASKKNFKKI